MFRNVFSGCVSDRSSQTEVFRSQKWSADNCSDILRSQSLRSNLVHGLFYHEKQTDGRFICMLKFGASLSSALKHGYLPVPLVDILVHIAKEGTSTADVFRRPGNPNDTRRIVKRLTEGKQVIYANYSFYTLASVVKKFLLKIPGGVFTPEGEEQLLQVLTLAQKMEQIEVVHSFMETLAPAHQQLIALLFGTWFRIVTYQDQNCMSVEALSRSVAGSMFHTCAEDPAKVEKASRIMQFLIDNFGVESMFGQENIRYFVETTHTGVYIQGLFHHSYVQDTQGMPPVRPDFIEVEREEEAEEDQGQDKDREFSESPPAAVLRHSRDFQSDDGSQLMINTSTLSAPEVSLVPSPDVSQRPKSLEDNLNEVRSHYQSRCLSRFNSVKRKQLERLRQRSDWFLSPIVRERNNSRKGKQEGGLSLYSSNNIQSSSQNHRGNGDGGNNIHYSNKIVLQQKNSGNSTVTKASSENAVGETFSDGDSMFTDNTSRSESPASEPVWSHMIKSHSRDIVHSDTIAELDPFEMNLYEGSSSFDLSIDSHDNISGHDLMELSPLLVRSNVVEEEEEEVGTNEDDDDNTTPTGGQEEEDTLMTSSIPDLQLQSIVDEDFAQSLEPDNDTAVNTSSEGLAEVKLKLLGEADCLEAEAEMSTSARFEDVEKEDLIQRQHSTQGSQPDEGGDLETDLLKEVGHCRLEEGTHDDDEFKDS